MFVAIADDDVPQIVAMINRAYRGTGAAAGWTTETAYLAGDRMTASQLRADLGAQPAASMLKWVEAPGASAARVRLAPAARRRPVVSRLAGDRTGPAAGGARHDAAHRRRNLGAQP